ncbi:MAG TPA: hypothetical protein VKX17_13885 [Planctomycetota bacterium]|nr:hypothetical protein [Planctomycetota bacterium]
MESKTILARCHDRGIALIAVFLVLVFIFSVSIAMLQVAVSQTGETDNTRDREQALMLADAGLNAAINELNLNKALSGGTTPGNPTANWGSQQSYAATSTLNADGTFTVQSIGTVSNSLNAGNITSVQRKIMAVVSLAQAGRFSRGGFAKTSLTLGGSGGADSYDASLNQSYSQQVAGAGGSNAYHLTPNGSGGNMASNGSITLAGNSTIYGSANPGPGNTVSTIGGATVTGSTAPLASPFVAPTPAYAPTIASLGAYSQSGGSGTITAGTYRYSTFSQSGGTLTFSGVVNLYVDGSFSQGNSATLILSPGAVVNVFQGSSASFLMRGGGVINPSQVPSNFNVVSSSTRLVSLAGHSDFYGTLYAPAATVSVGGTAAFYGAIVGNIVKYSGQGGFHYDKSATSPGIKGQFVLLAYWEVDL